MKTLHCFELSYNSDGIEGKGYTIIAARFTNGNDALAVNEDPMYYKKYGVMGTKNNPKYSIKEVEYEICDSVAEFWECEKRDLKKQALAKLTLAERNALGFF